ncbi:hypothetical protein MRB53_041858 [Persea americana]|nr:hypothetical protein MRB53_041858 [Persea americana]
MRNRSPAKSAASDPPIPGLISTRHGKSAKGCLGTRAAVRNWQACATCSVAAAYSSEANWRSSGSDFVSLSRDCSSSRDSFAFSHVFRALAMGASSPTRFAEAVSKADASFELRETCSAADTRARARSVGDMLGGVVLAARHQLEGISWHCGIRALYSLLLLGSRAKTQRRKHA